MNDLVEAALKYSALGWQVFPVHYCIAGKCSCRNPNCGRPGKHPLTGRGFKDATTDKPQIREWWREYPEANIGIRTGKLSGFVVVDIDTSEAKAKLEELLGYDITKGPTVKTGQGWQSYFKHSGVAIPNRTAIFPGIDFRGDGGYVIAPPSIHVNSNAYTWINEPKGELPELSEQLLEIITSNGNQKELSFREPLDMSRVLAGVPKGKRDAELFRAASKLRGSDVPQEFAERIITEAAEQCDPPYDERDPIELVRHVYQTYPPERKEKDQYNRDTRPTENPWEKAKPAPIFLAEEEEQFKGIAKDLLAPGAITLISAPRGLGKTHVAHALAIALATGGAFRDEQLKSTRVLLVDRDNPPSLIRERLNRWGAEQMQNLHVLTRKDGPSLKDKQAWEKFPTEQFDVVIIDSLGSFTEGVTEKEGKATTEFLATILDLARKDIAVLILHNTTKDASSLRGRGEVADRLDIIYEVRDATGFVPSGKKPWWEELPESGEKEFAKRATRRKGRTDYRLAFIPSKFRLAQEPEPFCLEINLPKTGAWTLTDVTHELVKSGEQALEQAKKEKDEQLEEAAATVTAEIIKRKNEGNLLLKSEAEKLLMDEGLNQSEARELIEQKTQTMWRQEKQAGGRGRGKPIALLLCDGDHRSISTTKKQSNKVKETPSGENRSLETSLQSKHDLSP